ncbi:MAG TPA: HlyD family efflux transporter periplasmic adaptor subunit [Bryobacteraceae bacterium]
MQPTQNVVPLQPLPSHPPGVEPRRGPVAVPPPPKRPRRWGWFVLGAAGIGLAAAWYLGLAKDTTGTSNLVVKTQAAASGRVEQVLRLTGVTVAETASNLLTPQLHGSRSGSNREPAGGVTDIPSLAVASRAGGNASPATSSGSTSNLSPALQAATSRTGTGPAAATQVSTAASNSTSTTMGAEGIGTSAADLIARASSSGPSDDFALILQEVVKPGSMVRKNQIVAEFDRQFMLTRLDDYKASVAQSAASLRRQKADLAVARKAKEQELLAAKGAYEKAQFDMKTIPVLSALDVQRTKLALEETDAKFKQLQTELKFLTASEHAQVRGSELSLEQTAAEFKRSKTNADKLLVKSPIDGLTVMLTTWRGGDLGQVQQGDKLYPGQGFMQIVDPRSMAIDAIVNQADAEKLRIGMKARVRFDAYPDLELPARVYALGGIPKSSRARPDWVKEIPVRLKLEQMDTRALPDLSVAADIIIDTGADDSVVVPSSSVFDQGGKSYVMVDAGAGRFDRRPVELGLANFTEVAIRAGLKPGERVALDGRNTSANSEKKD